MSSASKIFDGLIILGLLGGISTLLAIAVKEDLLGKAVADGRATALFDPDREIRIHVLCATTGTPFSDVTVVRVKDDDTPSGETRKSQPGSNMVRVPVSWRYRITFRGKTSYNVLSFSPDVPPDVTVNCESRSDGRWLLAYAHP